MLKRQPCEFMKNEYEHDEKEYYPPFPENTPIGMAYVPYQQWEEIYNAENGFCKGTVFPSLDYPFMGGDCCCE